MQKVNNFRLKDIVISEDFKNTPPGSEKMARREEQFKRTRMLSRIIINDANILIDGYVDYLLAVKYQIQYIDVTRGHIEVIEAFHSHYPRKAYRWKVPPRLQGNIAAGDKVLVKSSAGISRVTVKSVIYEQYPQQNPRLKWVYAINQKAQKSRE